jgi:hypothetical protein
MFVKKEKIKNIFSKFNFEMESGTVPSAFWTKKITDVH